MPCTTSQIFAACVACVMMLASFGALVTVPPAQPERHIAA